MDPFTLGGCIHLRGKDYFLFLIHNILCISIMSRNLIFLEFMYRYMKILKDYVKNTARPEGCIAESYLAEECMRFCSDFLKTSIQKEEKEDRNDDFTNTKILEGRRISKGTSITLTDREKRIAHLAVLMNTSVMDSYLE